jgi:hypothetical protein
MRTKTLLLSAVLGALSGASLMAQVYSLNAVGYVNVTCPGADPNTGAGGYTIIANQLNTGNNVLTNLIAVDPAGSMDGDTVFKYNPTTQAYSTYTIKHLLPGGWQGGTPGVNDASVTTLNPGEAAFFYNANNTITLTFVGTVLQGGLTNSLVAADPNTGAGGFNLVSSMVPQGGDLSTNLGLTVDPSGSMDGNTVYLYNPTNQSYTTFTMKHLLPALWSPSAPQVAVGQGFFFYNANNAINWTRTFTVN